MEQSDLKTILLATSKAAIHLNDFDFNQEQISSGWLGNAPASDSDIEKAKASLETDLPADYIEFLKITNGFPQYSLTGVEFFPISKLDYLINVDEDLVELWNSNSDLQEVGEPMSTSLLAGGPIEDQIFLLIPPNNRINNWRYWIYANWMAGHREFNSLADFLKSELDHLETEIEDTLVSRSKFVMDYSLRDSVFGSDWQNAYDTAFRFLKERRSYIYFAGEADLLKLMLLSASRLNTFEKLEKDLTAYASLFPELDWVQSLVIKFNDAARQELRYLPDLQFKKFVARLDSITLEELEEQTRKNAPILMKPKNEKEKIEYQLNILFEKGNAKDFIGLYEAHKILPFTSHFNAALVFAVSKEKAKAQNAVENYFKTARDYRTLEPFLYYQLEDIMTEDFSKRMLIFFK